ncbi:recombinase family protein [Actinomadura sp. NEAU-AAG7]|uniref:recombinase family protein n=1 Tax=Actinomadura sp. NEAU-AAG7 TaxID=2839640 RepID=UPI001BE45A09|nr:recombinase family protein [Actinomadura sp. NEAU-AAG7]MBT2213500.1 recombinase family protein [Actinomadura sp. NEAU-AAG7]
MPTTIFTPADVQPPVTSPDYLHAAAPTAAAIFTGRAYLRVSKDRHGRMRSPQQQNGEIEQDAAALGIILGDPYTEREAVSASRYTTKKRDGFAELLAELQTDSFGADILYLWESSRGSRRVGEWVTLLDLLEERGVLVRVKTHGRTYNPANPRDRRTLLEDAVDSEYESGKTSDRIRRDVASNAAEGRPHGAPNWGFKAVYDERTGRLINWDKDPKRAPIIWELFDRLKKGHGFMRIAADWEARGITNKGGKPFSPQHLRDLALKPTYTGLRVHKGTLIEAIWPNIVDRATFWKVQEILAGPKHQNYSPRAGRAVHEFTMIIKCDVCGNGIAVSHTKGTRYRCQVKGCVRLADKDGLDEILRAAIWDYLSRPDIYETIAISPKETAELQKIADDLAKLRTELRKAESDEPESVSEAKMMGRLIEKLKTDIGTKERRELELTTPSALRDLMAPGDDIERRWKAAPIETRRKVASILLTPEYLGEVRVTRSPVAGGRVPAAARIRWVRKASAT